MNKCSIFGHSDLLYFPDKPRNDEYMLALMHKIKVMIGEGHSAFISCLRPGVDLFISEALSSMILHASAVNPKATSNPELHHLSLDVCHAESGNSAEFPQAACEFVLAQAKEVRVSNSPIVDALNASTHVFAVHPEGLLPDFLSCLSKGEKALLFYTPEQILEDYLYYAPK